MQQESSSPYESAMRQQEEANKGVSKLTHGLEALAGDVEASNDLQRTGMVLLESFRNSDLVVQRPFSFPQSRAPYTRYTSLALFSYCNMCPLDVVALIDALH